VTLDVSFGILIAVFIGIAVFCIIKAVQAKKAAARQEQPVYKYEP
jgi:hypothetical protein